MDTTTIATMRTTFVKAVAGGCSAMLIAGCAVSPPVALSQSGAKVSEARWTGMALPGKRQTSYRHVAREGRAVIHAQADASASMYRQHVRIEPDSIGRLDFSWWVPDLIARADLTDRDAEDSPVRIVLAFDGDRGSLSAMNRMLFELAETLSGEPPPYATLMYVWDNRSALETVIPGGRTDRIRKIVVDSGPAQLKSWRHHQRDIVRDFERAFGESPGRLIGVALMTDSDNTLSRTQALYGQLVLTSPSGAVREFNE